MAVLSIRPFLSGRKHRRVILSEDGMRAEERVEERGEGESEGGEGRATKG